MDPTVLYNSKYKNKTKCGRVDVVVAENGNTLVKHLKFVLKYSA